MASACSILYEEQVLCSICLSEFKEPVSTPCGHNFCKGCITQYWNSQDSRPVQCPLCKKKLGNKPKLQVNSEFRDVVEHFNHTRVKSGPKIVAQPGEVPCDICTEPKLKAHKTCLVCLASYCEPHLESHQNLKKHKLIDPVSNLEDRVCKKHDKMLELFCCTDQRCVCMMCLNDDHSGHEAVPLERAFKDRRGMYENVTLEMKKTENSKSQSVKKLKDSVQKSRKISVNDTGQIAEILSALVLSLQKKQNELVRAIEQKQKESEKQTEGRITLLEQHLSDLRKRRSEIEQLIKSEDYLYLLQNCPPNLTSPNTPLLDPFTEQHTYAGLVKQSVGQIKKSINSEIDMLIQKISSPDCCGAENMRPSTPNVWRPLKDKLMMIQQCNAVDVTLNSYSAHTHLTVSADGKTLSYRPREHFFDPLGWRFKHYYAVLGNEGFSSGQFYYEVDVYLNRSWTLGVVKESIRRDKLFPLTPEHGAWVFWGSLCPPNIRRIGVFVDYERGELSFYNTETRDLLHSIAGCCFTETKTGLQAFLYSVVGFSTVHRPKLYPFFSLSGLFDILTITPVECTSQDA